MDLMEKTQIIALMVILKHLLNCIVTDKEMYKISTMTAQAVAKTEPALAVKRAKQCKIGILQPMLWQSLNNSTEIKLKRGY